MGLWGLLSSFSCCGALLSERVFSSLFCLFQTKFHIAQSRSTFQLSFELHGFRLLRILVVHCHSGITVATLPHVTLKKRCVALPCYIVYVYIYLSQQKYQNFPWVFDGNLRDVDKSLWEIKGKQKFPFPLWEIMGNESVSPKIPQQKNCIIFCIRTLRFIESIPPHY